MKMNPSMVILLCAFLLNQVVYGVDENNVTDNELNLSDAGKTVCKRQYESVYNETDVKNCEGSDLIAEINGEHLLDGNQATIQNAYLANSILGNFPKFDLRLANGVSAECRTEAEMYFNDVHNMELWALRMLDSSAKLPSGFLSGNLNQMGDFDQCLGIRQQTAEGGEIRGQYCLASFQVSLKANATDLLRKLHRLVHAHYAFRSQLRDPGHRVPRYSSINWALCVPSACSHLDVAAGLEYYLDTVLGPVAGLDVDVHVAEDMCQVQPKEQGWSFGTRVTGCFILALLALVLVATLYDVHTDESKNEYLMAFSLRANHSRLMSTRRSTDDISCVHGIRLLNSLMLIVSHKCMAMYFVPFINRTPMNEELGQSWTVIGRAASLYTDPFIMFSGLLTTYSILKKLKRDGQFSMWKEYSSRLARIVPPFAFLIAFCTWILPELGSGPQWPQVISHHATICKQYWWRNMLFIHNYYGFENMCLTHTHHVGIDTQLFLVTPPAVLLLWRYPRRALQAMFAVATLSTVARYAVTHYMNLSNYVFFGTSLRQLFETADNMYILPPHRATVYIMGIFLAYLLHNKQNIVLSKMQLRLGWSISTCLLLLSFLGPAPMGSISYEYRVWHAAAYAAFAPIAWCGFFAWVVFVSQLGHKSVLTDMLSWGGYAVWTRISYAVYLTQFPVFFYYVGVNRVPNFFSFFPQITNMRELFTIATTSIAMTLFIDLPCQNLKNIITGSIERRLKHKQSKQQDVLLVPSVEDRLMPIRDLKCRRIGSAKQS